MSKNNKAVAFALGMLFGWQGVRLVTHAVYLVIIVGLAYLHWR